MVTHGHCRSMAPETLAGGLVIIEDGLVSVYVAIV